MGNCIRHESKIQWGGDDWGSPTSDVYFSCEKRHETTAHNKAMKMEEDTLLEDDDDHDGFSSYSSQTKKITKEVKIKITKKQLEELLGKVDVQGLTVQQVLDQLMNVSIDLHETQQRAWRPNLQSIPEVN